MTMNSTSSASLERMIAILKVNVLLSPKYFHMENFEERKKGEEEMDFEDLHPNDSSIYRNESLTLSLGKLY